MPRKLVPRRYVFGTFPAAANESMLAAREAWDRVVAEPSALARLDLPGVLLSEYFRERHRSRLGSIVTAANAWPDWCETVVIVAPQAAAAVGRALFAAAAHPFYNHLSTGGRGGRPRLFFVEPTLDHDQLQGTLDLLKPSGDAHCPHDRWAFVAAEPEASPEIAAAAGPFLDALRSDAGINNSPRVRFCILSADPDAAEGDLAGDVTFLPLAAWSAPHFFHPVGLLASSIVGADVVQQLKGAVWFAEQAKSAPPAENEAIQLAEFLSHGPVDIVVWHGALEPLARDFAQQVNQQVHVVSGCAQAEQLKLLVPRDGVRRLHLWSEAIRRDRLGAAESVVQPDGEPYPDTAIERFVPTPQPLAATYDAVRAAELTAGTASAEIRLTRLGDPAIGELSAWLSTVIVLRKSSA